MCLGIGMVFSLRLNSYTVSVSELETVSKCSSEKKLATKFSKLKQFFIKNDIFYFMSYRFIGGGGTPYAIQNIIPVLFNMPLKNYIIATFIGSMPSMFVTVSIGSGIENVIDKNENLSLISVISSPEIYLPIIGFFIILIIAFIIKKFYFKQ